MRAAQRLLSYDEARGSMLAFQKARMPDPQHPDDPTKSQYQETPVARLLSDALERVSDGKLLRLAVSIPPQCGKSEIITRGFPAWLIGKKPWLNLMCATYNQDFANDFGDEVRGIITSETYGSIFPGVELRKGSKAKDAMKTTRNGRLAFLGRGGAGTGKPADGFIVDDPLKDDAEAQSAATREQVWNWFNKVAYTRCHKFSFIVVVHTRWHEDDLIGRLCDPTHPHHDPEIAKLWTYINIPAVVTDEKLARALGLDLKEPADEAVRSQFGTKPMAALWEERKPLEFLAEARRLDKRGFEALYQGNPSPEDGDYFGKSMLKGYRREELPTFLRKYAASDHALTEKQQNDASCCGVAGMDEDGTLWILPDIFWDRVQTDRLVEEMLSLMKRHKPGLWWAEDEHISKGIGPFLRARQKTERAYTTVVPITTSRDKKLMGRSIQGMMSLHKVRFPTFAHWWPKAEREILKFPNGAHDDFVSFLSMLGLGLDSEIHASVPILEKTEKVGTMGWIKKASEQEERRRQILNFSGGM